MKYVQTVDKVRVLIVDDGAHNIDIVVGVLEKLDIGLEVSFELKSNKVLSTLLNTHVHKLPHLIISDVHMPLLDGIDLCNILKSYSQLSKIPIILISADTYQEVPSFNAGASDFILKPIYPKVLCARVTARLRDTGIVKQVP